MKTRASFCNNNFFQPSNRPDLPGCADPPNSVQVSNCGKSVNVIIKTCILASLARHVNYYKVENIQVFHTIII